MAKGARPTRRTAPFSRRSLQTIRTAFRRGAAMTKNPKESGTDFLLLLRGYVRSAPFACSVNGLTLENRTIAQTVNFAAQHRAADVCHGAAGSGARSPQLPPLAMLSAADLRRRRSREHRYKKNATAPPPIARGACGCIT
jgi:hypothetical protein